MDFAYTEEQEDLRALARRIFGDKVTNERLREVEAEPDRFDRDLWADLAGAGLLGAALPEDAGGAGYGFLETCIVLEEAGRAVAPVPLLATLVLGAAPIATFGSDEQRREHLPPVVAGERVLTAALIEGGAEPGAPATTATRSGGGWRLDGEKTCVPAGTLASVVLVPARTGDGHVGVFLVDPSESGVSVERQEATTLEPQARLRFDGTPVAADAVLGDAERGGEIVRWIEQRGTVGLCALAAGVTAAALDLTAEHTKTRVQFERPIATFQAVAQRAADAYVDSLAVRLTMERAAWQLAEGLGADDAVAVAKFWAADGGQRVVHAAQHLHGGLGVDLDYPLHRYFLWAKEIELTLGGATRQLRRMGAALASGAA